MVEIKIKMVELKQSQYRQVYMIYFIVIETYNKGCYECAENPEIQGKRAVKFEVNFCKISNNISIHTRGLRIGTSL